MNEPGQPQKKPTPRVDLLADLLSVLSEKQAARVLEFFRIACELSDIEQNIASVNVVFRQGHFIYVQKTDSWNDPEPRVAPAGRRSA